MAVSMNTETGFERHYINGKQIAARFRSKVIFQNSNQPVYLGGTMTDALLDEVILFNRALRGNEIVQVFTSFVQLDASFVPVFFEQSAMLSVKTSASGNLPLMLAGGFVFSFTRT